MNTEQAKINMIKQQIHTFKVFDSNLLGIIEQIPREQFVPGEYVGIAFADVALPIGHGQIMFPPAEQARILQELAIGEDEAVLEVGTGTGYLTALMARLAKHVYSVDVFDDFVNQAQLRLKKLNIVNVTLETGNAASGWLAHQPYDVMVITGALPQLPHEFLSQLKPGGRIFAVLGESPAMRATVIDKTGAMQSLYDTDIPVLLPAESASQFRW